MQRPSEDQMNKDNHGQPATTSSSGKHHEFHLVGRESMKVDGVISVDGFDDEEVIIETNLGMMHVKGERLHIEELNLTTGRLLMTGFVKSVTYSRESGSKKKRGQSLLRRLIK